MTCCFIREIECKDTSDLNFSNGHKCLVSQVCTLLSKQYGCEPTSLCIGGILYSVSIFSGGFNKCQYRNVLTYHNSIMVSRKQWLKYHYVHSFIIMK
jgi:hypothetical protein